jgi:hypothetical protein
VEAADVRFGLAVAVALGVVLGCERSPSAPSVNQGLPQSADGRRTSIPGKAMDRAEDLKKEVDAYNQAIEDTMSQGTNDAPPKPAPAKGAPGKPPAGTP